MFDDHYYRGGDTHSTTTVKQQPNDAADAARLYGEVESKAKANVTEIIGKQLTSIKAEFVTCRTERSIASFKEIVKVVFKINGTVFEATIDLDEMEFMGVPQHEIERAYYRKVAEGITDAIMKPLLNEIAVTKFARTFRQ